MTATFPSGPVTRRVPCCATLTKLRLRGHAGRGQPHPGGPVDRHIFGLTCDPRALGNTMIIVAFDSGSSCSRIDERPSNVDTEGLNFILEVILRPIRTKRTTASNWNQHLIADRHHIRRRRPSGRCGKTRSGRHRHQQVVFDDMARPRDIYAESETDYSFRRAVRPRLTTRPAPRESENAPLVMSTRGAALANGPPAPGGCGRIIRIAVKTWSPTTNTCAPSACAKAATG